MSVRTILIIVILVLVALLTLLNWGAITTPISLNVAFTTIEAPLGLLLLIAIGALTATYLIALGRVETTALIESRRRTKEVDQARKLAEESEESRFESLRQTIDEEMASIHAKLDLLVGAQDGGVYTEEDL